MQFAFLLRVNLWSIRLSTNFWDAPGLDVWRHFLLTLRGVVSSTLTWYCCMKFVLSIHCQPIQPKSTSTVSTPTYRWGHRHLQFLSIQHIPVRSDDRLWDGLVQTDQFRCCALPIETDGIHAKEGESHKNRRKRNQRGWEWHQHSKKTNCK